ncbi:MAG TPA: cupin domain-containing protein [Solirubrobacteraceae bacterium]|jgi:quercetin dioxygenase-like cupin family protein|nr:cupin domain-containing protein [Solirubrobacteraceae bacterium]
MAGDPTIVWMPGQVRTEIHLTGADTAGAFCLLVDELPAGWRLPAHRHRGEAETMHVLSGAMAVEVEGEERLVRVGETAYVPRGVLHSGHNAGAEPLRRVVIFSPAGMEDFFLQAGAGSPEEVDARAALDAALAHGWEFPGAA